METIIKKAKEGGYSYGHLKMIYDERCVEMHWQVVLDPLFWKSLGKACGWYFDEGDYQDISIGEWEKGHWKNRALRFHEINLTQSWDDAIKYIMSVI